METFLLLWFALTSAAFIAYVIYDFKVTARSASHAGGTAYEDIAVTPEAAADAARAAEEAARTSLERLNSQINRWDWQQAAANAIASLNISGSGLIAATSLANPLHSFPRQMVHGKHDSSHFLNVDDLRQAVENYHRQTKRPLAEIWQDLDKQFENFLDTQDSLRETKNIQGSVSTPIELRPDLSDKIREVRSKHPFFNGSQPLHQDQLKRIFDEEKIEVHYVKGLPLLSLFVEYTDEENNKRSAVVVREDDVHQALKEFLLGHELGHWFLHFDSGFAERFIGENYYLHSSPEWRPLELDADAFAMTALFPTPYLANREIYEGTLSEEKLFEEFTAGMSEIGQSKLKKNMLEYIGKRVERYRQFKDAILPVRIPVTSVQVEDVEALVHFTEDTDTERWINWVQMDQQFLIIRASRNFIKLFDRPAEQIIGKLTPLDLVMPDEVEPLRKLFELRLDKLKAIFYFTRIQSPNQSNGRRVAVYSFPILRGREYAGSIGYLIPIDQIPPSSFNSATIHTT